MKKNITVSYIGELSESGTFYNQKIKISKDLKEKINNEIKEAIKTNKHKAFFNSHDYIYIEEIKSNFSYVTLTTCRIINSVLKNEGIDTKRIKDDRNTIIEFV